MMMARKTLMIKVTFTSWAQWLTPAIPGLQETEAQAGVQDQPGQHGKTPSLLKIQKSVKYGGTSQ